MFGLNQNSKMPGQTQDDVIVFNKIFVMYDKNSGLTENDFDDLFREYGAIEKVQIATDMDTGNPKGVCYITFSKTSEACLASEGMNNKSLPGHHKKLKVYIAHDRRGSLEIDVETDKMLQRLFVNHPKNASQEEVKDYFQQFGEVIWMYQLKDKNTGAPRGSAFIKYELQSQAAIALETCNLVVENNYRARWADVRKADPHAPPQRHGLSLEMSGSKSSHRQMGEQMGGQMAGQMGGQRGDRSRIESIMDIDPMSYVTSNYGQSGGGSILESLVPKSLSQQQIFRLFDVAPGLQNINQDNITGMVTCQYMSSACATYAKEKLDGIELYGQMIAVRFAKGQQGFRDSASNLQDTLMSMPGGSRGGASRVQALVEQLHQVTEAIAHGGIAGGSDVFDYEPVSSVRLPPVKKLASPEAPVAAKVFINTMPPVPASMMPDDVLLNVCCRFGGLISVGWVPGKRYGFATYAHSASAQAAVNKLNGAVIDENHLKVEMAKSRDSDNDGPNPQKRARQF